MKAYDHEEWISKCPFVCLCFSFSSAVKQYKKGKKIIRKGGIWTELKENNFFISLENKAAVSDDIFGFDKIVKRDLTPLFPEHKISVKARAPSKGIPLSIIKDRLDLANSVLFWDKKIAQK